MQRARMSSRCWLVMLGVVLLAAPGAAVATDSWIVPSPDGQVMAAPITAKAAPVLSVGRSDQSGFTATLETEGFAVTARKTKGGEFLEVTWPNSSVAGEIGTPGLPVMRRLFVAPAGADVSVAWQGGKSVSIDLADLGFPYAVKPVQAPIPKLPGAVEAAPFVLDEVVYGTDADLLAEPVRIEELGVARGQRLFLLEMRPVSYNPVSQQMTFWPDIVADVSFTGGGRSINALSPLPGLQKIVLNPEVLSAGGRGSGNYLIITGTNLESYIAPFAAAKTAQGFTVTTHAVSPGTSNSTIKSYIQGLWGTADAPEYVLLVGDVETIPHWDGQGEGYPDTDLQYACMDGSSDWYPDLALGRFPADNSAELQILIDKTLYYENGPLADPEYKKRAVFMAGDDNHDITEGTHEYVINTWLEPNGYQCDRLYEVSYGATTQDVTNAFNDGRFYGIYSGHGGSTSWSDGPAFSVSNVDALTNENMYPMICSFACSTGDYAYYDECFMETWVLAEDNNGAVTAWGSSVSSYWDEDDILERVLFDAIFDNTDDVKTELGPLYTEAKLRYLAHWGATSTTRRYLEMYNLMGDPALALPSACSDAGAIALDRATYACESTAEIEVTDCGLNLDDGVIDTVNVTIKSDSESAGETVTLYETDTASAQFAGSINLSATNAVGVLLVGEGDTVTATYIDADDGQGGVNVEVIDTALVDCQAPGILDVQTTDVEPRSATVSIDSDEPIRGTVYYGESCGTLTGTATGSGYADPALVNITGLDDDTTYFYTVEAEDEAGNSSTDDNGGSCYNFSTPPVPDYFTEEFGSDNDLDNLSLFFIPNGSYDYYKGCVVEDITELPTDPSGGTSLSLSDDDYEAVTLSGAQVSIYGTSYSTFYPGSNGYITFGSGDSDYDETLAEHFDLPRISGIYDDLDPAQAGTVSWKQLADRAVVTWSGVTEHNSSNSNTFQIEMYFDGKIVISYLSVAAADGIAGLSEGEGLDPDFYETDLSDMGPCGPQPPDAFSGSADTAVETPVTISLQANDDGLPDPPAALTYIVTTLPGHGTLYDTGDSSEITSVPYTLYNYGNQVDYYPEAAFHDTDTFQFKANDGGTPVEGGGDSNTAVITITVGGPAWDPVAYNVDWGTGLSVPADIELSGSDPNSDPLTFVIESLPPAGEGYLSDPGAGLIETVPYTLVSGGDVVRYYPPYGQYLVTDFDFSAWDATTGSNVATVTVTVGVPQVIHSFDLDTDPGWSTEEQWEFGQPTGGGSHNGDPSSGYTGQNVYGYNLSGDYALGMTETYYLTTTAIDCSSVTGTELRFQRWLGVEAGYWDQAIIEVSNNGVDWTPVWEHVGGSSTISESSWSLQSYDISSEADDEATVYLRWGMGPTDTSTTYPGWNLDDIEIWGGYELPPGDYNADLAVDLVDYMSFVDCMAGPDVPPSPQEPLSSEDHCLGAFDFDEDSDVDLDDFGGFQAYFGS